ncbi:hypothetical protein N0V88_001552 [Collariella sp. IMI 366227]|nr:hypothetical protein N0V88_001552 [Collariella sp. IMI 366227]
MSAQINIDTVTVGDHDWSDLSAELYTLAIGLNMLTFSENYDINKDRQPLLLSDETTSRTATSRTAGSSSSSKPLFEPWTGVIFANGTKRDDTPSWFLWEGPLVTVDGLSFHNTSVLTTDTNRTDPLADPARFMSEWFRALAEDRWSEEKSRKLEQQMPGDDGEGRSIFCHFWLLRGEVGLTPEHEMGSAADPQTRESWNQAVAKVMPPATALVQERRSIRQILYIYEREPDMDEQNYELEQERCSITATAVLAALASVPSATAGGFNAKFLRFSCSTLVTERLDPIVWPGLTHSPHLHVIAGGNMFNATMDPSRHNIGEEATCTTCTFTEDFSNYWTGTLFFQARNGSLIRVPQRTNLDFDGARGGGMSVYYTPYRNVPVNVTAFAPGFRMTTGNPTIRTRAEGERYRGLTFTCLDTMWTRTGETMKMPKGPCKEGIMANHRFPTCWDGVNLDSPDHQSHVAYPENGTFAQDAACPASHSSRLCGRLGTLRDPDDDDWEGPCEIVKW